MKCLYNKYPYEMAVGKRKRNDKSYSEADEREACPNKKKRLDCNKSVGGFQEDIVTALKDFLQRCECEGPTNVVHAYFETGRTAEELVNLLQQNKKVYFVPVLSALHFVVITAIRDAHTHKSDAEEACKYLLDHFFPDIQDMLSFKSPGKHKKILLKLLCAMVTLSAKLAHTILVHIKFAPNMLAILTKNTKPAETSVRVSFIHFLMSFFIDKNSLLITSLLLKKGVVASVISELIYDDACTVNLVLTTLHVNVVMNPAVSKTLKLLTFSTPVIKSLLKLYDWKGPEKLHIKNDRELQYEEERNEDNAERIAVVEVLHDFLITLCTSHKHGVAFHDKYIGTSNKKCNELLQSVLESMERPWENQYLTELILKILNACPDLMKGVLSMLEVYLEPRISLQWTKAVDFAQQVIQSTDPDSLKPHMHNLKMQQLTSIIHTLAFPASVMHIVKEKLLCHSYCLVRHEATRLLSTMLGKFLCYTKALKSWKLADESISQSFCNEVMKQMPNPELILSLWQKAFKNKDEDKAISHQTPNLSTHLSSVVDLWLSYNECFPSTLNITNSSDLINDIQDIDASCVTDLQLKVLKLVVGLDSSTLIQKEDVFRNALLLLSQFINHPSKEIKLHTRSIFIELLINSGIFEGVESEANIWVHCCFRVPHKHIVIVIQCLLEAMLNVNKNPNSYITAIIQSEESVENYGINKDDIVLEQLLDDHLEAQQTVNRQHSHAITMRSTCQVAFSLLLPAMLKLESSCKEHKKNSGVNNFLSSVIIHLLHSQSSPGILWHLVQNTSNYLPFSVSTYIDGWLSKGMALSPEVFGKDSTETELSRTLINGEENCILDILHLEYTFDGAGDENVIPVFLKKQTVFVSKASASTADPGHLVLLYKLALFHLIQLAQQDALKESSKVQCQDALVSLLTNLLFLDKEQNSKVKYATDCLKFTFFHPNLLSLFMPLHKNGTTMMITEVIQALICSLPFSANETYQLLIPFKQKMVHQIMKYVHKYQKLKINEERNLPKLSLYGLTSSDIVQLMNALVLVPTEALQCCKGEIQQLSIIGRVLIELLNLCVSVHEPLASHHVAGIAEHLVKMKKFQIVDISLLEDGLYRYLDKFRHNLEDIPAYLFCTLLLQDKVNASSVQLAALLIKKNVNQNKFVSFVRKNRKLRSKSELLFPLLSSLFELCDDSVEQSILEKVYIEYGNDIRKGILSPINAASWVKDYVHIAVLLLDKCMDLNICVSLCKQMESGIECEKSEDICLELTKTVLCKVKRLFPEEFNPVLILLTILQHVNGLWKRKIDDERHFKKIYVFAKECAMNNNNDSYKKWEKLKNSSIWMNFVNMALKYGIQLHQDVLDTEGQLLQILMELCSLVYRTAKKDKQVLMIFQMALSHSEFLAVMLGAAAKKKCNLIKLLLVLMEKNPLVMSPSHIPMFLSSYHATLDETDQALLKILQIYEAGGTNFHSYRPYLWGDAAVNHYGVKLKARFALLRQPNPNQVLDLLEMGRVQETVKRFPVNRCLDVLYSTTDLDDEIYDIAFLLPLFSHLLSPEQFIQTYKFISCGGLALTLSALASECETIRKAAYHILSRFYFHEEASRNAKKQKLCLQFLNALRLGIANLWIDAKVPQLSCIAATFLARASLIISQANHPLYSDVQNFIIAKPCLNLEIVPEFLTYFHSAAIQHRLHQSWILEVLRDGFKGELDIKVCLRSAVFKLLLNFYFSVLADVKIKVLILEVINSVVKVPNAAYLLVTEFGLISQLFQIIRQFPEDSSGKTVIINVLYNLWGSLSNKVIDSVGKKKRYNLDWSQQMLMLLLSVLMVKPKITELQLKIYLSIISSALSYGKSKTISCFVSLENIVQLLQFSINVLGPLPECEDLLKFGCRYAVSNEKSLLCSLTDDNKKAVYYLRKIIVEWLHKVHSYSAPKVS